METRSSKKITTDENKKTEKPSPPVKSKVNKRKPQAPKKQQANQVQPPKVVKLDKTKQKALIRTQRYNSWEVKISETDGQPQYKRVVDPNVRISQPKGANRRPGNSSKAE